MAPPISCIANGKEQSGDCIIRQCIILRASKGDDFITDPSNHSTSLGFFFRLYEHGYPPDHLSLFR